MEKHVFLSGCFNIMRKEVYYMRKFTSFVMCLILCMSLAVPAAAVKSNQGGTQKHDPHISPKTGSTTVAALFLTTCAAGGVGVAAYKKSKE